MIRPVILIFLYLAGNWRMPAVRYTQRNLPAFRCPERSRRGRDFRRVLVPGIVQDKRGFIWLATRDGLCRYDGRQFRYSNRRISRKYRFRHLDLKTCRPPPTEKSRSLPTRGKSIFSTRCGRLSATFSRQAFYQKQFGKRFLRDMYADHQHRLSADVGRWRTGLCSFKCPKNPALLFCRWGYQC